MPGEIAALRELVQRGEPKLAGRQAHKIKGVAANVSAGALCEVAARMEQAGEDGDRSTLATWLPELEHQFQRLKQAMEA
jgi:HPt (histidine-containing phosphotransfer) domain-containing protein